MSIIAKADSTFITSSTCQTNSIATISHKPCERAMYSLSMVMKAFLPAAWISITVEYFQ